MLYFSLRKILLCSLVFYSLAVPIQAKADTHQAALAQIEATLQVLPKIGWLPAPFNDAEAQTWVQLASSTKQTAQQAIVSLQQIGEQAELPLTQGTVQQGARYDHQNLGRLQRFAETLIRQVDESVQETNLNLRAQFEVQDRELTYFRELNPDNANHRSNAYLVDGAQERIYGQLDQHAARAHSVAAWQRAFGTEPGEATRVRIHEIDTLRLNYAAQRAQLIGDSRLPDPASTDAEQLKIAADILATPRFGFGKHGPIVLTTPAITDHEREVSRAEIRAIDVSLSGEVTLSGTETTWHYRWQEFRFATPIQNSETGDWHIWWITARNYSSGWEKTPLNQWVSGAAVQGDLIPEANF